MLTKEKLQTIENSLKRKGLLHLEGYTLKETNSRDFIINFLKDYRKLYNTVTNKGILDTDKGVEKLIWNSTFTKYKHAGIYAGRLRSLGDIFRVTRYYFPQTTLQEVVFIIRNLRRKGSYGCLSSQYCSTVNKRVHWLCNNTDYISPDYTRKDEYGFKPKDYNEYYLNYKKNCEKKQLKKKLVLS